jgi:DNA-directed RNA polymerase specialized sigma subunit
MDASAGSIVAGSPDEEGSDANPNRDDEKAKSDQHCLWNADRHLCEAAAAIHEVSRERYKKRTPPAMRIRLAHDNGLTIREIAAITGLSHGRVGQIVSQKAD